MNWKFIDTRSTHRSIMYEQYISIKLILYILEKNIQSAVGRSASCTVTLLYCPLYA